MVKDLWILKAGKLNMDRSLLLMGSGFGKTETIPIYATLLKTPDGYILIDTGMHTGGVDDPEIWGERGKDLAPCVTKDDDVSNRLREIDVAPSDIKYVIHTHMHWDHTGGDRRFPNAAFIVQKAEYRYAFNPDKALVKPYIQNHYVLDADYRLIEGDVDLCAGVRLLQTPGHTPGHQSVLITFDSGKMVIFAGDAMYTWDSIDKMHPSGNLYSYDMAMFSLNKLKTLRDVTGAAIIPSHAPGEDFYDRLNQIIVERKNR